MTDKSSRQRFEREEQILLDKRFIDSVNDEIVETKRKQVEHSMQTKKYLMDSWKRDQEVKLALKVIVILRSLLPTASTLYQLYFSSPGPSPLSSHES